MSCIPSVYLIKSIFNCAEKSVEVTEKILTARPDIFELFKGSLEKTSFKEICEKDKAGLFLVKCSFEGDPSSECINTAIEHGSLNTVQLYLQRFLIKSRQRVQDWILWEFIDCAITHCNENMIRLFLNLSKSPVREVLHNAYTGSYEPVKKILYSEFNIIPSSQSILYLIKYQQETFLDYLKPEKFEKKHLIAFFLYCSCPNISKRIEKEYLFDKQFSFTKEEAALLYGSAGYQLVDKIGLPRLKSYPENNQWRLLKFDMDNFDFYEEDDYTLNEFFRECMNDDDVDGVRFFMRELSFEADLHILTYGWGACGDSVMDILCSEYPHLASSGRFR